MKNKEQLINNIIGQLNGISKMIRAKQDCRAVITQFKAVKSAVNAVMGKYIEENVDNCFKTKIGKKEKIKNLVREIIKNN